MNTLKVGLLLIALTALFVGVGGWLGGPTGMGIALVLALATNFGTYWFSDRLVLRMTRAQPVDRADAPDLYRMLDRLSERAGIPTPRLYLVPDPQPNAFATGRSPRHGVVALNQGLLAMLDARELEGVVAHELAHIRHRDTLTMAVVASVAGAVLTLVNLAQWSLIFGGSDDEEGAGPWAILVAALVAPLAATVIQLSVSRAREFEADATAADLTGTPEGLVGALRKLERAAGLVPAATASAQTAHLRIVNPLAGGGQRALSAFSRLFLTHPPVEERVERLRARYGAPAQRAARPAPSPA